MRVAIATFGCKLNQYETQLMIEQLKQKNIDVVDINEKANFFIINSCAVTSKASKEARMLAKRLSKISTVIYTGCDSYLEENLKGKVILVGNSYKNNILKVIEEQFDDYSEETKYYPLTSTIHDFEGKSRAFVKIQEGCNNHCTYCIIPFLRGKERDKPKEFVIKEIRRLINKGFAEIVLTGTNIGSYTNFKELLKEIPKIGSDFRIRISSIEPMYVDRELIDIVADLNFAKHLHIPLQSGSDKILKLMGRDYKKSDFERIVDYCHKKGIFVGTDVIVGFFEEDEEAFKETVEFLKNLPVSFGHVFSYSKRPFTPAESLKGHLPRGPVVRERNKILRDLFDKKRKESIKSLVGKELELVVETTKVKNERGEFFKAISSEYVKVLVKGFRSGLIKCKLKDFDGTYGYGEWLK